jgi:MYXO-CTERM domain-containing protein
MLAGGNGGCGCSLSQDGGGTLTFLGLAGVLGLVLKVRRRRGGSDRRGVG